MPRVARGRSAVLSKASPDIVPLFLPETVLRNGPGIVHIVLIRTAGREFTRTNTAVSDSLVYPASREWAVDLIHHRDIGARSDWTVVSHPDIGLDARAGIGGTAA